MSEYVSEATVKKRATKNGWRFITDRNRDGATDATEQGEIDSAIEWAGTLLDELVAPFIQPSDARGQSNTWLRDRALDLAVYRLFTNGGDDAPAAIERGYADALAAMQRIRGGVAIPGLTSQHPPYSDRTGKIPRAFMPS